MKLIGDRILIEPIKQEKTTESGIFLAKSQTFPTGKVLCIGNKVEVIKEGDTIRYNEHNAIPLEYEGKKCLIVSENNDDIFIM